MSDSLVLWSLSLALFAAIGLGSFIWALLALLL